MSYKIVEFFTLLTIRYPSPLLNSKMLKKTCIDTYKIGARIGYCRNLHEIDFAIKKKKIIIQWRDVMLHYPTSLPPGINWKHQFFCACTRESTRINQPANSHGSSTFCTQYTHLHYHRVTGFFNLLRRSGP